ncbi:MAG: hypothetical protein NPINA01_12880 [Nitrospinaceae bacterium]|nr:MAG: hypothetical protein NPINA01_12880 [Nitrospinaceae bacterium]
MDRSAFEKLWFTGNVRVIVDDKKALHAAWKGHLGKGKKRSLIVWGLFASTLAGLGIWIMTKAEFALSPVEIGFSWWGMVLFLLASGIPFLVKGSAAQTAKNKIIRDPEFYSLAKELELFDLEEYY